MSPKLNRHVERVFNPDRKETHWGKRKLEGPMTVEADGGRSRKGFPGTLRATATTRSSEDTKAFHENRERLLKAARLPREAAARGDRSHRHGFAA